MLNALISAFRRGRTTGRHIAVAVVVALTCAAVLSIAGAATARGVVRPHITRALCIVKCAAGSPYYVQHGGRLELSGHLLVGELVQFDRTSTGGAGSSSRVSHVLATLRSTSLGLVVTVPSSAISGHIAVIGPTGVHSNPIGPIVIRTPPKPPRRPASLGTSPSGTAFDGNAMWIWYLSQSDGGNISAIAAQARKAGVTTVFIKSSDGGSAWSQFAPGTVAALKARGLHVCGWQYVYGSHPIEEADLGAQAKSNGAECLLIDAESEYEGRYASAQTYIQHLRSLVGPSFPIALASFPYVDYHPQLPYSVFLGPGGAQFNAPQMYWRDIGVSVDYIYSHTYTWNREYQRPIIPLGQSYTDPPPSDLVRFRQLASAYGANGLSWWDWQETTGRGWQAIGQSVSSLSGFAPATGYPVLSKGSSGDPVVWMQEHLATAVPSTPTSGVFDSGTQKAVESFQSSHGLTVDGVVGAKTWSALLALSPTPVDWVARAG